MSILGIILNRLSMQCSCLHPNIKARRQLRRRTMMSRDKRSHLKKASKCVSDPSTDSAQDSEATSKESYRCCFLFSQSFSSSYSRFLFTATVCISVTCLEILPQQTNPSIAVSNFCFFCVFKADSVHETHSEMGWRLLTPSKCELKHCCCNCYGSWCIWYKVFGLKRRF